MKAKHDPVQYRWLIGSLCVWLLCAWVTQQPMPARKTTRTPERVATRAVSPTKNPAKTNLLPTPTSADSLKTDPETGLALDKNLMLVKGQCTACHSSKLILQSHFDREKWVERIRWMQRTQKLWDLGASEPAILTYLTTYYGPINTPFDGRRLPLNTPVWYKATR